MGAQVNTMLKEFDPKGDLINHKNIQEAKLNGQKLYHFSEAVKDGDCINFVLK